MTSTTFINGISCAQQMVKEIKRLRVLLTTANQRLESWKVRATTAVASRFEKLRLCHQGTYREARAPVGGLHQCLCTVSRAVPLHHSCIGDALQRGPLRAANLIAQTEGRVEPRFRLPSVDRRNPSSVGMEGCFLPRLRACRKGTIGSS
jgi:hypothetical protein